MLIRTLELRILTNIKHFCKQQSLLSFNEFRIPKFRSDKGN